MIPLTLWSKDSGEDFKVLIAVHVYLLHVEDQTLAETPAPAMSLHYLQINAAD